MLDVENWVDGISAKFWVVDDGENVELVGLQMWNMNCFGL